MGNVCNMVLHFNAATLRGLTYFFCGLYNAVLESHSVQNPPWQKGDLYTAQGLDNLILHFLCDMGVPCLTYYNSKRITQNVYKIEI